jgi:hypothetical protein
MTIQRWTTAGISAVILCGCATTAGNSVPTKDSTAAARPATCLGQIGNRITDSKCSGFVRSYSQEDLQRTGKTTVGGALPMLDSAVVVTH